MEYLINLLTEKEIPPHKHTKHEIIIFTKGCGNFYTEEKSIEICPGKIIIVPPQTVHYSVASGDVLERIYINGYFSHIFNISDVTIISDNAESEGLFLAKMAYINRHSNREYVSSLVNAFTHFLLQSIEMKNEIFLVVKSIVDNITTNFHSNSINLNTLLKKSGYAGDYVRSHFKKITGKTPTEFLTEIRISHACYLIDTYGSSLSLYDVSEKCGYTDYVYFSRRFKHITGLCPREYANSN